MKQILLTHDNVSENTVEPSTLHAYVRQNSEDRHSRVFYSSTEGPIDRDLNLKVTRKFDTTYSWV